MAINDIVQTVADARVDARSLSDFVFKPAGFKVPRRLAPPVDTLQFYIDRFNSLNGDFSSSVSVALSSLNNSVAEADGKVAYIETTVQDAINNTAVEGGVLADTFVTATAKNASAFARNQRDVNSDITSVKDFIDPQNATGDHSQAFVNAHLKDKKYYVPSGTYNVDSSIVDIDTHSFTAGSDVTVVIDGVAKDYSYATAGAFRSYANSNFNFWENTKSGNRVARWSNGASQSDSHQFYLPLEVVRDGHGFLLKQKTAGAGVDIMFQDHLSDDLIYLIVNGKTDNCQFTINYDTTPKIDGAGGGAGGFDSAMQVVNKLGAAQVIFPSAPVTINQGLNIRQRGSSATTNYKVAPNSLAGFDIKSQDIATDTDIATLMSFKDKSVSVGAKTTIIGSGYYQNGSQRRAFNVVDGGTLTNSVKNTYMITSGSQDRAMGEFSVIFILADNNTFTRTARFKSNGTTVTFEESSLNDTLPATLIGTVKYEGDALVLVLHNNGYTGTLRYTVQCDWIQTYYK